MNYKVNKPIIIVGAGGHAKVLVDCLLHAGLKIEGIVDRDSEKSRHDILGIPVIGDDSTVLSYSQNDILLVNGLGSVQSTIARKSIYLYFKEQGYSFAKVIHPTAIIGYEVAIGEGVQIMAGAIVQPGCTIHDNSILNTGAMVDHDCVVGKHVHIAPGVRCSGGITVGDCTHIGTGATVRQGINIGENCLIAAGSVVVSDVANDCCVMGIPAKVRGKK
ncbi:MAG TPA: acetyltransferase [Methylomusa anaerophila]|uniref:acetyltransferase n=1 Tax=Methylomusa anaerophila TaxID=1930071 RepID=UPI001E659338|nr:acetyltransferase [Methylomusa anaerophila]HML88561.1 acetyltransferase [Methylomusa anaerophila]